MADDVGGGFASAQALFARVEKHLCAAGVAAGAAAATPAAVTAARAQSFSAGAGLGPGGPPARAPGPDLEAGRPPAAAAAAGPADGGGRAAFLLLRLRFQGLYSRFVLATGPARLNLSQAVHRDAAERDLRLVISSHNFTSELRGILCDLKNWLAPYEEGKTARVALQLGESLARLQDRICGISSLNETQAQREAADAAFRAVERDAVEKCDDCALDLIVEPFGARCPECHRLYDCNDAVYEDAQVFSPAAQNSKTKSGCFSPNKHCAEWMTRILAQESDAEIGDPDDPHNQGGEKLLAQLREEAARSNQYIPMLTVDSTRRLLRRVGRTDLNRNVPLIIKKLTGVSPPCLNEAKRLKGEMMFAQVIHIRNELAGAHKKVNRNYYPYYLYKIYDLILEREDPDRFMLWFIHLQSSETLTNNDREWKLICDRLKWEWRPTDPARTAGYWALYSGSHRR